MELTGDLRERAAPFADAAVCLAVGLVLVGVVGDSGAEQPWRAIGMVAGVAQAAALWWRRSRPEPVLVAALAGGVIVQLIAGNGIFPFAALVALGSLTYRRPPRVSLPAAGATLAVTALAYTGDAKTGDVTFAMAFPVVIWAVAEALRNRREAIAEAAARAAGDEQARLARELHDVIAHSLSVIVVQASAADDVFDARPDQARAALRSIEGAGREALGELRRLLAGEQPGLDRLAELAEPLRAAGLEVSISVDADASPAVAGSAYRIVQEALTNTLRHARASRAEVVVRASGGALELDVRDDGRGGAFDAGAGRGIAGMRERAALLGGTLEAGPRPEGGFRVHARLPASRPPGSGAPRANTPGEASPQGRRPPGSVASRANVSSETSPQGGRPPGSVAPRANTPSETSPQGRRPPGSGAPRANTPSETSPHGEAPQ